MMSNRCGKAKGFTAIEIISLLLIIGVLAIVAVARLTSSSSYKVDAEAELLKANIRYVQFRAMSDADTLSDAYTPFGANDAKWKISFSGNSYTLQNSGTSSPIPSFPGTDSSTHTLPSGINLSGSVIITFDVWGSPEESDISITVTDEKSPKTITVTEKTGFIP